MGEPSEWLHVPTDEIVRDRFATDAGDYNPDRETYDPYFDRWLAVHDAAIRAEQRETDAKIAEASTRPLPGHGTMNEGSRSAWYSRGVRDAAARIREGGEQ